MWFAWLLRTDARASATLDDPDAQREFVVWWLLYGHAEYPAAWWFGPKQVAVAMEPVNAAGRCLPRLLRRLYADRRDVQAAFPLRDAEAAGDLLCWYRLSGPIEASVAPALPGEFLKLTGSASSRFPWSGTPAVPRMAAALHSRQVELQNLFDPSIKAGRAALTCWYRMSGHHLIPAPTPLPEWVEPVPPPHRKPTGRSYGVNLVGFARAEFGIGEDVRSVSGALEAVAVPHVIVDVKSMPHVRARDLSRVHLVSSAMPYQTSIFCLTAFDTARLFLERGPAMFDGTFNIGYWPWEIGQFPPEWADAFALVDEVWAATRFQWRAYQAASQVPVFLMPPAVVLPNIGDLRRVAPSRQKSGRFRFIFPFDPNSFLSRKNPVAAIRAFRLAFPRSDRSVELMLRVNGRPDRSIEWRAVQAAIHGDTRIVVISATMDRVASLALVRDADCLVSSHRTEGFGRNIAEAIALGVPVLATGGSGPDDFLRRGERMAFRPRVVAANEYPFAKGMSWSDPVVADLARNMRRMRRAGHGGTGVSRSDRSRTIQHAPRTIGINYMRRLGYCPDA
jgi:glycosyltransferase involved in cell wall biosynthesis